MKITPAYVDRLNRALARVTGERNAAQRQSQEARHQLALALAENAQLREALGMDDGETAAGVALRTENRGRATAPRPAQETPPAQPRPRPAVSLATPVVPYAMDDPEIGRRRLEAAAAEAATWKDKKWEKRRVSA